MTVCTGLVSSKWHKDLTRELDTILSRELEKLSVAINIETNDNTLKLLWHHFDRLHYMQAINDGKYEANDPKMCEPVILVLKD